MKINSKSSANKMLRNAEKIQKDREREGMYPPNENDTIKILQDLQIHQIELEMQNDELRKISSEFETAKLKYINLYEFAPVGYFTLGPDITIKQTNLTGALIFNVNRAKLIGKRFDQFIGLDDRASFRDMLSLACKSQKREVIDINVQITSTRMIYLHLEAFNASDDGDCLLAVTDISDLKRTEMILRESEMRFAKLFEKAPLGYQSLDENGCFIEVNETWLSLLGYTKKEVIGKWFGDFLAPEFVEPYKERFPLFKKIGSIHSEFDMIRKDKTRITIGFEGRVGHKRDGSFEKTYCILQDITESRKNEDNIKYLSYHDHLTGLYNRRFYEEELERLDTERNLPLTILMGDVNGLKLVNDSFGHVAGDQLLQIAAESIKKACRADDIIARLGGDEFVIILPRTDGEETKKIIQRVKEYLALEKVSSLDVSVSFGFETKHVMNYETSKLLKDTEDNMYKNKLYESSSSRSKTISLIMNALFEKNNREMLHSNRVSEICQALAEKMHLDKEEVKQLKITGLMHDIGKIGIDENILNSDQSLSAEEWAQIRKHPEIGSRILSTSNEFFDISADVLQHHERWDGKGYPNGLKGEEISLKARIIAIADTYDAMMSDRAYRKAYTKEQSMDEISRCSGTQFDPKIVQVFMQMIKDELNDI